MLKRFGIALCMLCVSQMMFSSVKYCAYIVKEDSIPVYRYKYWHVPTGQYLMRGDTIILAEEMKNSPRKPSYAYRFSTPNNMKNGVVVVDYNFGFPKEKSNKKEEEPESVKEDRRKRDERSGIKARAVVFADSAWVCERKKGKEIRVGKVFKGDTIALKEYPWSKGSSDKSVLYGKYKNAYVRLCAFDSIRFPYNKPFLVKARMSATVDPPYYDKSKKKYKIRVGKKFYITEKSLTDFGKAEVVGPDGSIDGSIRKCRVQVMGLPTLFGKIAVTILILAVWLVLIAAGIAISEFGFFTCLSILGVPLALFFIFDGRDVLWFCDMDELGIGWSLLCFAITLFIFTTFVYVTKRCIVSIFGGNGFLNAILALVLVAIGLVTILLTLHFMLEVAPVYCFISLIGLIPGNMVPATTDSLINSNGERINGHEEGNKFYGTDGKVYEKEFGSHGDYIER